MRRPDKQSPKFEAKHSDIGAGRIALAAMSASDPKTDKPPVERFNWGLVLIAIFCLRRTAATMPFAFGLLGQATAERFVRRDQTFAFQGQPVLVSRLPLADMPFCACKCLLLTQSGHVAHTNQWTQSSIPKTTGEGTQVTNGSILLVDPSLRRYQIEFTKFFEEAQMSLLRREFLLLLQMAWLRKLLALLVVGIISISSAPAATISIDFEGPRGFVNNYYNGGTDSTGASGPNLGVIFLDFLVDGDDIFFVTQFPNNFATNAFLAFMDVPAGFTALSLAVHSGTGALINAWSGLEGSGSQIGSNIFLPATSAGFETIDVPLTGTAKSLQFIAPDGHLSVDDIRITTITSVSDTPLPAALPLFASGAGALGFFGWRRKKTSAALVA